MVIAARIHGRLCSSMSHSVSESKEFLPMRRDVHVAVCRRAANCNRKAAAARYLKVLLTVLGLLLCPSVEPKAAGSMIESRRQSNLAAYQNHTPLDDLQCRRKVATVDCSDGDWSTAPITHSLVSRDATLTLSAHAIYDRLEDRARATRKLTLYFDR